VTSSRRLKIVKLVVGILLLPCCVAITITFLHQLGSMARGGGLLRDWRFLCLALGFISWLVIYLVMPLPVRAYVLGHELTHAIWGWMMGAKVRGFKAGVAGGHVKLSKTNFLITLSPYFFPFYCILAIVLFLLGDLCLDWERYKPVLCLLIGLGWGFHLTFTVATLLRRQTDVAQNGWLFSMAVIYWMNFLVLGLLLATILLRGNVFAFLQLLWRDHAGVWTYLLRAVRLAFG
jgi:hypothetical protein